LWSTWACPRQVRAWPPREGHPRPRGVEARAAPVKTAPAPAAHLQGGRPGQGCTPRGRAASPPAWRTGRAAPVSRPPRPLRSSPHPQHGLYSAYVPLPQLGQGQIHPPAGGQLPGQLPRPEKVVGCALAHRRRTLSPRRPRMRGSSCPPANAGANRSPTFSSMWLSPRGARGTSPRSISSRTSQAIAREKCPGPPHSLTSTSDVWK